MGEYGIDLAAMKEFLLLIWMVNGGTFGRFVAELSGPAE
jgi:hypothetical protein